MSFDPYVETWTPVRFVPAPVRCEFCMEIIPRSSPGSSRGTRGTKAFYQAQRRVWNCIRCHDEDTRAQLARYEAQRRA